MEDGGTADDYNELPSAGAQHLFAPELNPNGVDQSRTDDMQIVDHDDKSQSPDDRHVIHAAPTGAGHRHSSLVTSLQVSFCV